MDSLNPQQDNEPQTPEPVRVRLLVLGATPAARRYYRRLRRVHHFTRDHANFIAAGFAAAHGASVAYGPIDATVAEFLDGHPYQEAQ